MIKEFINRITDTFAGSPKDRFPLTSANPRAIQEYNKTRKPSLRGSFCYAPDVNMLFGQDGKVRACCHNMEFALGEYPKQSIAEIWRGAAAEQLRTHLKNFDLRNGCEICQVDVNAGSFEEVRARQFDSLPRNAAYPTMMEFLMTNTCNFECVMCRGEYSSLIRKNREKLSPIASSYDKEFIRQLEEFMPHLHETRFSGSGEAFAIDMNYEIWEMILRLNPKCIIMVQTNGSYLNARIKDLLDRGNFRIGVSLDSLNKENFESIRVNANFERVMENIQYFSDYCKTRNQKFALALCVMRQNWRELPEFINFCNEHNAVATLHKVWFPMEYSLHNLPFKELSEIHAYLDSFDFPLETKLQRLNRDHYKYMVGVINSWKENAGENKGDAFVANSAQKWRDATFKPNDESIGVDAMHLPELMPYLKQRLKRALQENNSSDEDIENVLGLCDEKLGEVLNTYDLEAQRENILRQICKVPAVEIVKSLRHASVEAMIEQAKMFLVKA